jgi:hypothetical protein
VALLREFEEGCATPPARLRQVVDAMVVEMHAGLASDGGSKLKMLLTFVDALPNGYGPQGPSLLAALHCYSVRRLALRFPLLFLAICRALLRFRFFPPSF